MPPVDVAPIYSDAWTKNTYEGMARLIQRVPDVADKTIGGVTCQLWCVRFFYTEINHRRWLDVADITTWQDTLDRYVPFALQVGDLVHVPQRCQIRHPATQPAGVSVTGYFNCPALDTDQVILGIGISYCIETAVHADSYIYIQLRMHDDVGPPAADIILKTQIWYDQSNTYVLGYAALASPHTIAPGECFVYRVSLFAKEVEENAGYLHVKAPFLRLERSI